eukprot:gnl/Spiro4/14323_TR7708_c0_g1_i1.p1 gnl/Spiro4/14323_TR7708_c0_g1~~gnl/Spiro4/14323_TR7708_c0_g1_i1.p1  ORF type:complete len:292 (+),score=44.68 gnl/Spiro4/14323_TR7708_c0_g1_i1:45-920(+)
MARSQLCLVLFVAVLFGLLCASVADAKSHIRRRRSTGDLSLSRSNSLSSSYDRKKYRSLKWENKKEAVKSVCPFSSLDEFKKLPPNESKPNDRVFQTKNVPVGWMGVDTSALKGARYMLHFSFVLHTDNADDLDNFEELDSEVDDSDEEDVPDFEDEPASEDDEEELEPFVHTVHFTIRTQDAAEGVKLKENKATMVGQALWLRATLGKTPKQDKLFFKFGHQAKDALSEFHTATENGKATLKEMLAAIKPYAIGCVAKLKELLQDVDLNDFRNDEPEGYKVSTTAELEPK